MKQYFSINKDSKIQRLEEICSELDISFHKVILLPTKSQIASVGSIDLFGRRKYLIVTNGFLSIQDVSEMKVLLLHEKGHLKHMHQTYLVLLTISGLIFSLRFLSKLRHSLFEEINAIQSSTIFYEEIACLFLGLILVLFCNYVIRIIVFIFEIEADMYARSCWNHGGLLSSEKASLFVALLYNTKNYNIPRTESIRWLYFGGLPSNFLFKARIGMLKLINSKDSLSRLMPYAVVLIRLSIILTFLLNLVSIL